MSLTPAGDFSTPIFIMWEVNTIFQFGMRLKYGSMSQTSTQTLDEETRYERIEAHGLLWHLL